MAGFKIDGVHSSELNIKVRDIIRPILPEINDYREKIPGRDGTILFPLSFGDKNIIVDCVVLHESKDTRVSEIRNIALKLYSFDEVKIEFDDEPDVYYEGKISQNIEIDQYQTFGFFSISFICKPFSISVKPSKYTEEFDYNSEKIILVESDGTVDSEFFIKVTPSVEIENLSVSIRNEEIVYTGKINKNETYILNTEGFEANIIKDENVLKSVTDKLKGQFPIIQPGENKVEVKAKDSFSGKIEVEFSNRYL